MQSDGKIVVGGISGTANPVFGVARLNSDGTLDSTFGNAGKLTTQFFGTDQALAMLVQSDGKIVAVGQTLNRTTGIAEMALARYR